WWIGDTDTGISAEGQDGADGQTPNIGENGNWWIGDTDTGVSAEGQKGDKGDAGDGISLGSSNLSSGNNISQCVAGPSSEIFALVAVLGLVGAIAAPMLSQYSKVIGDQISTILQPLQDSGPNQPAWLVQVNRNLAQVGTSANELVAPIVIGAGILAALGAVGTACDDSNGGSSK
ncbi:hypothetical protein, partial [Corynebacterium sp. A21]|uniref:hypothetical protein n=1 Tax=Corynebacterium sp. A21 TaxID=3457318 RepID=UPI003FD00952